MIAVVDRIVQYANRYRLTNAETGEVLGTFDFDEVTGTVQQVGTEINKALFDSIATDLSARVVSNGGELSGTIVTFSDISGTAANVASGDTSATLWGKVKNWFSRLKALAFKDKISNTDIADNAAIAQSKISGLESALDAKANDADLAAIAKSGDLADATQDATHRVVTDTEKATWNAKQNAITGAASTIVSSDLTESRALVSDASGKVAVSDVTATELGYLDGVKSNIQEQLDNISSGTGFVSTSPQTLTTEQQAQARENIGAASVAEMKAGDDKSYYNLGAFDTYVDNGDGTATITRKTKYGDSITEQTEAETSYTEDVILDQPIHTLDVNGEQFVRDEWEKGLNLFNGQRELSQWGLTVGKVYTIYTVGAHTKISLGWSSPINGDEVMKDVNGSSIDRDGESTFIYNEDKQWKIFINPSQNQGNEDLSDYDIMLVEGDHAYPYQPYNGAIVHEKQLDDALENYLPRSGGTMTGNIDMGTRDIDFRGSDPGDVVFRDENNNDIGRIYIGEGRNLIIRGKPDVSTGVNIICPIYESGQRVYSPNNPQTTIAHADNATAADSATKATQDSDGNTIKDTYQKVHHLYEHKITLVIGTASVDAIYAHLTWYSNKQEAYTREEFLNEFRSAGIYSTYDLYPATGRDDSNIGREKGFAIIGICPGSAESIYFYNSVGQYFLWRLSDKLALMFDDPRIIF